MCELDGRDGQLERLAGAVRQRQLVVLAIEGHRRPRQRCIDDRDVFPGAAQRLVEPHAVPALGDLRAGDTESQPETATGQHIQAGRGHRRHRRGSGWDLHDGRADMDARRLGGEPGKHGRAIRAVRLGRPDHREAKGFGMLGQPQLPVRVIGSDQIAEVEPETHGSHASGCVIADRALAAYFVLLADGRACLLARPQHGGARSGVGLPCSLALAPCRFARWRSLHPLGR